MPRPFKVCIDDTTTYDIEVVADSRDEAIELAWEVFSSEQCPQPRYADCRVVDVIDPAEA